MATIKLFSILRSDTKGKKEVNIDANTVQEIIDQLESMFGPELKNKILDKNTGDVRRFISVFINGVYIRTLKGLSSEVKDDDEITFLPAVGGGKY